MLIYALESFTATDGTVCTPKSTFTLTDAAGQTAIMKGQAQRAEMPSYSQPAAGASGQGITAATYVTDPVTGAVTGLQGLNGEIIGLVPASYTWAGKPAASSSNAGQTIRITDVGKSASGSLFQSDGTIWRPVNGSVLIGAGAGSIAAPIVTFTGAANGALVLPSGNPTMPANFLPVGAIVKAEAIIHRRGANGTATFWARLGNNGASTDNGINGVSITATDLKDSSIEAHAMIASATSYAAQTWLAPQGSGVSAIVDRTSNAVIASPMIVSFDIAGANASDAFDLIMYKVTAYF